MGSPYLELHRSRIPRSRKTTAVEESIRHRPNSQRPAAATTLVDPLFGLSITAERFDPVDCDLNNVVLHDEGPYILRWIDRCDVVRCVRPHPRRPVSRSEDASDLIDGDAGMNFACLHPCGRHQLGGAHFDRRQIPPPGRSSSPASCSLSGISASNCIRYAAPNGHPVPDGVGLSFDRDDQQQLSSRFAARTGSGINRP